MSMLRKQAKSDYTHLSNDLLGNEELSFRARGIAAFLLSKPNDWIIKIEYLVRQGSEGREAIRAALQELATHGYLMRDRLTDEAGKLRTVTYIADYPAYINVGTVERRILGYEPPTELRVSGGSDNRSSVDQGVGAPEVLLIPDLPITDLPTVNRKKDQQTKRQKKARGADTPGTKYDLSHYSDL